MEEIMDAFAIWWHNEGSAIRPSETDDYESFSERVSRIAWSNGAYKQLEIDNENLKQQITKLIEG